VYEIGVTIVKCFPGALLKSSILYSDTVSLKKRKEIRSSTFAAKEKEGGRGPEQDQHLQP